MLKLAKAVVESMGGASPRAMALSRQAPALASELQLGKMVVVTVQLALVLFAIRLFGVEETTGFHRILPVVLGGFVIHAFLPIGYRQPFYVLLTWVSIVAVFGGFNAVWLIGLSLGLILLAHLPIDYQARIALIVVAGT
ncbi:MAG: hypothetical protein R2834_12760 [Rhodothermales bacterium]